MEVKMKRSRWWVVFAFLVLLGASTELAFATESVGGLLTAIDLEGKIMDAIEMEEILGGLPRACHDPNYDPIENACLNNKGQKYIDGVNDCDIWAEKVLGEAGISIVNRWGPAKTTKVKGHEIILANELSNVAPAGWSVEVISYGSESGHIALVRTNNNGSADVYHQGSYINSSGVETWESHGIHYPSAKSHRWGKNRSYWDFD
jgi:hypothetical protein